MSMETRIQGARDAVAAAEEELRAADAALDDPDGDLDEIEARVSEARETFEAATVELARLESIQEARKDVPAVTEPPVPVKAEPQARGSMAEAQVYRPDGGPSYFRDMVTARNDVAAAERLSRHAAQVEAERRDLTTTATAGGGFVPPIYLGDLYAEGLRAGRPFANALGSQPLPSAGMSITLPRITTNPTSAVQAAEGDAVSETDLVEATVTTPVVTIAGQQDVSIQLLERSDPGIDMVLFSELTSAYNTTLDNQLLNGAGASGEHTGITTLAGTNGVTYTDASPTAAEAVPVVYEAFSAVHSNRFRTPDLVVMHPRRHTWFASNLSSTFPLFQLGQLNQAAGTQGGGGIINQFGGIPCVVDANVVSTNGAGTNEDEIYVLVQNDLILYEDNLRARVFTDVLSGTLEVRLQVFAYSAFIVGRYPAGIAVISGTGLVNPY